MTWLNFSQQYETSGRKKLDGYSAADFEGMDAEELKKAEAMLIKDAKELDTSAFQGLAILKTADGEAALREILGQATAPGLVHLYAAKALYDITEDEDFLHEMMQDIESNDRNIYEQAVVALAQTKPSEFQFEVMKFVITESSEISIARSEAAGALIRFFGFPPFREDRTTERQLLEGKLFSATVGTIGQIIEEIKQVAQQRGYAIP
ncbi:MAG: hypothetical protein LBV45_10800 [Xanthomonadaceae bacterium]|jgi:hypothetical protein|nr:hypothetical protein [Xanthomonadaceae bacterium]